jgi:hypothetical protein
VDGVTWQEYGRDLEARLSDLHGRIHSGAYTPASASAIDALCREQHYKARRGIYSLVVVIWLMIYQRLNMVGQ